MVQVRKDERGGFRVDGQTQLECSTAGAALRAMAKALTHRHTRAHAMNEYSSRSHCLMTFNFASQEQGEGSAQGAQGGVRRCGAHSCSVLPGSSPWSNPRSEQGVRQLARGSGCEPSAWA